MRKYLTLIMLAVMICCLGTAAAEGYPEVVNDPATGAPLDFGGETVTIYDYWSGSGGSGVQDEALINYRNWLETTYHVKVRQMRGGDWGTCAMEMTNFNNHPDGSLRIYIIEPGKVGALVANGVAAPINGKYVDLSSDKWNQAELDFMTVGNKTYGLYAGNSEPRGCLYFNKRVLEEAGIDWNTIYDMQAVGTWTWSAFESMLKKLTRDTDNDGVCDLYGLVGSSDDAYVLSVFANGGSFFDFDETGKIVPTAASSKTKEALNWFKQIQSNYWMPQPEGSNWDWYKDAWKQGYVGFYVYQAYGGFSDNSEMSDMVDAWGCVAWPVPNMNDTYVTVVSDNITMIPSCYDKETVARLALIYDLWTNPAPGYDSDGWIGNKYNYTDERAVDETYAMLRDPAHCRINRSIYLGTQNDVLGADLLWYLETEEPEERIESSLPKWNALCDTFNASMPNVFDLDDLDTVYIPDDVSTISEEAFAGIDAQAVVIPSGCQSIGSRAFANCPRLQYVVLLGDLPIVADDAFEGCGEIQFKNLE